jgi:hypothetical protein
VTEEEKDIADLLPSHFLARLKELTEENEHMLARWYVAKQFEFTNTRNAFANMLAEHILAGEMSDALNDVMVSLTNDMLRYLEAVHGKAVHDRVRACL